MHANPKLNQIATNQAELEGAIAEMEKSGSPNAALLLEHLRCAKVCLLGGMPDEYAAELEMARTAAAGLPDKDLRGSLNKRFDRLRDDAATSDARRSSEMAEQGVVRHRTREETPKGGSRLWNFFGTAPVQMGTFYPTSFVACVVPSYEAAEKALHALRDAGFGQNDAIAVRGGEMSEFLRDLRERSGAWGQLMSSLSRMLGTEQLFTDVDEDLASSGKGFLMVYSPEEDEAKLILRTLEPFHPLFMQRYLPGAVEGMIKPASVTGPER